MAVRSGREYLEGLRDSREVWLEGERVDDVTTHPKLRRMAATLASMYDLQHDPKTRDLMSFESPVSGQPISLSYMIPESVDDLVRRRQALEVTAGASFGMLGRTPDYVNMCITAVRQAAEVLGENDNRYSQNAVKYYEYVSENDLCLTHTFGHPQSNRSVDVSELADPYLALGVVKTNSDGVIVRGARLLATLAPFSDEIFAPVYRPLRPDLPDSNRYCIGFAIPAATPGLKFICRQSYDRGDDSFDYPLSGRYDEMDCLAVFDDVLIPWERVFAFDDVELGNRNLGRVLLWRQYMQQVMVKNIAKLDFMLGITYKIADAIGINIYSHVQEKISEIVDIRATVNAYMRASEVDAAPYLGSGIWLAPEPLHAMRHWFPDAHTRIVWIIEQLSASGLMLTPTHSDVTGPLADLIGKYYQGAVVDATDRIRLFRLAWDLVGTQFGSRQALYERFFNGDTVVLRQRRYAGYDYTSALNAVDRFFESVSCPDADIPAVRD